MKFIWPLFIALILVSCKKEQQAGEGLTLITSLTQLDAELAEGVSMVFYHASWCHICQDEMPKVEATATDPDLGGVFFGEVEYDDHPDILNQYNIVGFPTIVIYQDGIEVDRFTGGGHTTAEFKTAILPYL